MNTRKRNWVKSAFSQLPTLKTDVEIKPSGSGVAELNKEIQIENNNNNSKSSTICLNKQKKAKTLNAVDNRNWIDCFAPTCVDELAVHSKKIAELQNWFNIPKERSKPSQPALCLLSGPSGSGKTATACLLAKSFQYQIQEWINPVDQEMIVTLGDQTDECRYMRSQVEAFKGFLLRASRYKSVIDVGFDKRLLLVEDFPNGLLNSPEMFETILEDYLNYGKSPLMFIIADGKSRGLNINYKLFPEHIKTKFHITHICFNPISLTLMQKAMKRFCSLIQQQMFADVYKAPLPAVVDSLVVCAQGDIRNAIINLHFASLKGAPNVLIKSVESDTGKNKLSKKQQSTLRNIGCDESITMMHAVGRVLNPKFTTQRRFLHSPEQIAEAFSTEPKRFIDLLHANYLPHFSAIEHINMATDALSQVDLMLSDYRDEALSHLGLNVGVRSLMVSNAAPTTGWMPVRGSKRLNTNQNIRSSDKFQRLFEGSLNQNISESLFATDYSTFVNVITKKTVTPNKITNLI